MKDKKKKNTECWCWSGSWCWLCCKTLLCDNMKAVGFNAVNEHFVSLASFLITTAGETPKVIWYHLYMFVGLGDAGWAVSTLSASRGNQRTAGFPFHSFPLYWHPLINFRPPFHQFIKVFIHQKQGDENMQVICNDIFWYTLITTNKHLKLAQWIKFGDLSAALEKNKGYLEILHQTFLWKTVRSR